MILVVLALVLGVALIPKGRAADGKTRIEITSATQFYGCMSDSKHIDTTNYEYVLKADIDLTPEVMGIDFSEYLKKNTFSFGSKDYPFKGVFDGEGHTIKGLKHLMSEGEFGADTGLFAQTEGAVIRNLTITNADINADQRGGILAGKAVNTIFENVSVKDSYIRLSCANNVLTLVTDGGLRGGGLIGEAVGCTLYNCETINTRVNNNNTAGVAALSGKGLYLGGLIGQADGGTVIEYCRVTGEVDKTKAEPKDQYKSQVTSSYDTAVGALGGNTLYVGGIVGELSEGSKVIDCFATPYLYFYTATYVSVGAGNSGNIGGIAAAVFGVSCEITRCHYAGKMESRQYNAVLVIPIIQNDVGLAGIAEEVDKDWVSPNNIKSTYYKESLTGDVNTLGNDETTSDYGPQSDEHYLDQTFWEGHDYDFAGTTARSSRYNEYLLADGRTASHANKWVMDYTNGYPVHGKSVAATLDFPGAGTVTIGKSELVNASVSTSNPYVFAVQAINFNEGTIDLSATANTGYRFVEWYKVPAVTATSLAESHSYFDKVFAEHQPIAGAEANYADASCEDNDLFIARYQAQVKFHDVNGTEIGTNASPRGDNWYYYKETLPEVIPENVPEGSPTLIGWTTVPSGSNQGYANIANDVLETLRKEGDFYETGDEIVKTMDLYPVYKGLLGNVITVMEGNELDENPLASVRDGVGDTSATMTDGKVTLHVKGANADGTFPDGYRFLGWYENGHRISTEQNYILGDDVDLTVEHTYEARMEYRVDYWVRAFSQGDSSFEEGNLFASLWYKYGENFNSIAGPVFIREKVEHWGSAYVNHGDSNNENDRYTSANLVIVKPTSVYSHNTESAKGSGTGYAVYMDTDFPGAGSITEEKRSSGAKYTFNALSSRYHLQFWTLERKNDRWTYADNPMDTGMLNLATSAVYKGRAMVTADIVFYDKSGNIEKSVVRRYDDSILMGSDSVHEYYYPHNTTTAKVDTTTVEDKTISGTVMRESSPINESMYIPGYHFLGWINASEVAKDSAEWNYIYDVSGDSYCTSNKAKAEPYLVSADDIVTEAHDLYPVYARYNATATTNIHILGVPEGVNKPEPPVITWDSEETEKVTDDGQRTITLTIDLNKPVSDGSDEVYKLVSVTCEKNGKVIETLQPNDTGIYTYDIEAGPNYRFIANYEPLVVVYHLDDTNVKVVSRNVGDVLGEQPYPNYNLNSNKVIFVGWTATKPTSGYHQFNSYAEFEASDATLVLEDAMVIQSMELWPVFVKANVTVDSNIDDKGTAHRYLSIPEKVDGAWIAYAEESVTYGGTEYRFEGWNVNGTQVSNNHSYVLESNDLFSNKTFTARYEAVEKHYQIHYHGKGGNILYTAEVLESDTRTFVTTMMQNDQEITVPVDMEAFVKVAGSLAADETFREWRWVKVDSSVSQWDGFCDKTVVEEIMKAESITEMHLYPVIRKVTATDSEGNSQAILVGATKETNPDNGTVTEKVTVGLENEYAQSKLTVHIEDISYGSSEEPTKAPVKGVPVDLYMKVEQEDLKITTETTDENGNAVFELSNIITIQKTVNDGRAEGTFVFDVYRKNEDDTETLIQSVAVTLTEPAKIKVPFGKYVIKENTDWAWRYSDSAEITVKEARVYGTDATVTFDNEVQNKKWFDYTDRNKNEFKSN